MIFGSVLLLAALSTGFTHRPVIDWRNADISSMGIAPLAAKEPQAIVQIYGARTVKWRGYFAVHTWIAVKEKNAATYTTLQVIGFRLKRTGTALVIIEDLPDRRWYGAEPELLAELRGPAAERAIPAIHKAALSYPYAHEYRAWPGPNSNTFVSHVIRHTPELQVELPPHAIGRDWLSGGVPIGFSESGSGLQLSLLGALGLTIGIADGLEVNLLGLGFGFDLWRPALKLPFVGRLGMADAGLSDPAR